MTDGELFAFCDVVRGLERVFPRRVDEHERGQRDRAYFGALKRFPLGSVQAGADAWMQRGKFFPKPAEWIDAIPRAKAASVEIPAMTEAESQDYRRAEAMRYEDKPCRCHECQSVKIDKPIRFVPTLDRNGDELRRREGDRTVTAGHWAHGAELARWYKSRADFYEQYVRFVGSKAIA